MGKSVELLKAGLDVAFEKGKGKRSVGMIDTVGDQTVSGVKIGKRLSSRIGKQINK